ncbi:MAG: TPR repeat domain protein [Oceanicaulis sp. HLUCCA04]|nr:MAG: TPR repeat domain protein [Oceanicaulis sp. HLUCCA04]
MRSTLALTATLLLTAPGMAEAQKAPGESRPASQGVQPAADEAVRLHAEGIAHHAAGRFADALAPLERSSQLIAETLGQGHPATLRVQLDYALSLEGGHRYADASAITDRIVRQARDPQLLPLFIEAAEIEARLKARLGDYANALELYELLYEYARQRFGARSREALDYRLETAMILSRQARVEEAETLARSLVHDASALQPPDFNRTYRARWVLADVLRETRRHDDMIELYLRNLEESALQAGPDSAVALASLLDLAMGRVHQGEFDQARMLAGRAWTIYERRGQADLQAARALNIMAIAEAELGPNGLARAEALTRQALTILSRTSGAGSHDALQVRFNLASYVADQGRMSEAQTLHRENYRLFEDLLGAAHPQTALSLEGAAIASITLGADNAVQRDLETAITAYDAALSPEHAHAVRARTRLARFLLQGETAPARALAVTRTAAAPIFSRISDGQNDLSDELTLNALTTHVDALWAAARDAEG